MFPSKPPIYIHQMHFSSFPKTAAEAIEKLDKIKAGLEEKNGAPGNLVLKVSSEAAIPDILNSKREGYNPEIVRDRLEILVVGAGKGVSPGSLTFVLVG